VLNLDGNTRFELESARCAKCRARRTAPLPDGVTRSVVGTGLLAGITHMTGLIGVPRRPTQQFFEEVLGKKLSLGTISVREEEASAALVDTGMNPGRFDGPGRRKLAAAIRCGPTSVLRVA